MGVEIQLFECYA